MSELLSPNTYGDPPTSMRIKYAFRENWVAIPFVLLFLIVASIFTSQVGMTTGMIVTWLVLILSVGLALWGAYWHGIAKFHPTYTVRGVDVEFSSTKYYVPEDVMAEFIEEVLVKFEPLVDFDTEELLKGVQLYITDERPKDPANRVPQSDMVGLSYVDVGSSRRSFVYGPYALSHGGAGYELRLQACGFMFPGRPEGEDIDWMKANEVL